MAKLNENYEPEIGDNFILADEKFGTIYSIVKHGQSCGCYWVNIGLGGKIMECPNVSDIKYNKIGGYWEFTQWYLDDLKEREENGWIS